ncbi:hypothetical protein IA539_00935 [Gordonia sp. zg691]|uniref:hypothetical protein n=1 Tax=Gordonia jinghuaiqii TaxID=2758710 RepID=UPI0016622E84|nr:hypothetical protein [Gordonia jinghuaiqii]MBD0859782.1 hypothetical protein [Gordonia jinghuaiqii]
MTPLPSEVIVGVRRILRDTIAPELTSGHARARLDDIRAVLAQVDWDDAGFHLARRCHQMATSLQAIDRWRASDGERTQDIPEVTVNLPAEQSTAAYSATYRSLASAAAALVDPMADWMSRHPDDNEARRLHQALLAAL